MTDHDGLPLEFDLPFPPSVNHYWRHIRLGKRLAAILSAAGRQYRADAIAALSHVWNHRLACPLRLSAAFRPPDRRGRDLDNYAKALLDAMQHAGVFTDDAIVWDLHLRWDVSETGEIITWPHGRVHVRIERFEKLPGELF